VPPRYEGNVKHADNPTPLAHLAHQTTREPVPHQQQDHTDQPALYDTGLSAEEGLWARRGWAGRT